MNKETSFFYADEPGDTHFKWRSCLIFKQNHVQYSTQKKSVLPNWVSERAPHLLRRLPPPTISFFFRNRNDFFGSNLSRKATGPFSDPRYSFFCSTFRLISRRLQRKPAGCQRRASLLLSANTSRSEHGAWWIYSAFSLASFITHENRVVNVIILPSRKRKNCFPFVIRFGTC